MIATDNSIVRTFFGREKRITIATAVQCWGIFSHEYVADRLPHVHWHYRPITSFISTRIFLDIAFFLLYHFFLIRKYIIENKHVCLFVGLIPIYRDEQKLPSM